MVMKDHAILKDHVTLKDGTKMPRLGMGTWFLGEQLSTRQRELEALKGGLDAGIQLIDTAEMYGNGASERLVGQAIRDYDRKDLFLVSKVLPHNAGRKQIRISIDHSLSLLQTDYLDLYLLHWRGRIPLAETVECMEELVAQGKIRRWGVSNFDVEDMEELMRVPGGDRCAVNQVLYHLGSRGIEYDLLPWQETHGIPVMAYCPLAQAGSLRNSLTSHPVLRQTAEKYQISIMQLLLLFVLRNEHVIAIPRSGRKEHVLENWKVREVRMEEDDWSLIDKAFPGPRRKMPLDIV